jgi:uncharacterized membrane protein
VTTVDPFTAVERLEAWPRIDVLVDAVDRRVPLALREGRLREQLSGTWLGHALHPLLTDLPLGMWMSATVLDLVGGRRSRAASTTLTGLGVVAVVPTAASGVVEWLDTGPEQRRVGVVHAAINSLAATLYLMSFTAKLAGRRRAGTRAALAGGLVAVVGGYLGGHLSFARGTGVDHTVQERNLRDSFPVELIEDGDVATSGTGGRYLVLTSTRGRLAVPDRCTRCGGPLRRVGTDAVACVADGSRFAALAGTVERGPATTPLPRFAVTEIGGRPSLHKLRRTQLRASPASGSLEDG